jgi:hypothetical protein
LLLRYRQQHAIGWDISSSAPFSQQVRGCLLHSLLLCGSGDRVALRTYLRRREPGGAMIEQPRRFPPPWIAKETEACLHHTFLVGKLGDWEGETGAILR